MRAANRALCCSYFSSSAAAAASINFCLKTRSRFARQESLSYSCLSASVFPPPATRALAELLAQPMMMMVSRARQSARKVDDDDDEATGTIKLAARAGP